MSASSSDAVSGDLVAAGADSGQAALGTLPARSKAVKACDDGRRGPVFLCYSSCRDPRPGWRPSRPVLRTRCDTSAGTPRLLWRVPSRARRAGDPDRRRSDHRRRRRTHAGDSHPVSWRYAGNCRREGAGAVGRGPDLSPGRTRIRPLRPRGSFDRCVRCVARACVADGWRADDRAATADGTPRKTTPHSSEHRRPLMNILFIGDIVGRPGREMIRKGVRALAEKHAADLVIANAENSAAGFGITKDIGDTLLELGVDVMTSGNHIWDKKEVLDYIGTEPRLLRPANYPAGVPGRGSYVARTGDGREVGVINVMGRVFMTPIDDPFAVVLREIEAIRHRTRIIIVDFHAEATSEKVAMGWHLDGKATLVVGTHTHVQTADERILPNGTAYLTDAGMTGPHDSIIGMERDPSLARFLTGMPTKFEPATANPRLNGVLVTAEDKTGRATAVTRISYSDAELTALSKTTEPAHAHQR